MKTSLSDTRNEYETRVGLFENGVSTTWIHLETSQKLIELANKEYKDKQIIMYCTGGIR